MNLEGNESTVRKITTSEGNTRQNVNSKGESSNLRQMKRAKRTQGTSNAQSSTTDGISKEFGANKNTSGPSNENVSAANVQSDPAAGSNVGNQLPQSTASCLSQGHGSVMDCSTNSSVWPKSGHPRWPKRQGQNDKSMGESSGLRQAKRPKTNQDTTNPQSSTTHEKTFKQYQHALANEGTLNVYGRARWKLFLLGAPNAEASQIPLFNSIRDQEERKATSKTPAANLTNKSASGLFRQPSRGEPSNVMKASPEPTYKILTLGTHKIRGKDFLVRREMPDPSNLSAPNNRNQIFVSGPCLHPNKEDPKTAQREEFHKYFSHFGYITVLLIKNGTDAKISFRDNHDFLPDSKAAGPTKSKERLGANQNTSGPSNENVSAPNIQSGLAVESNVGNQLPQAKSSSSSLVHESGIDLSTISKEWSQSRGLASFDKPGWLQRAATESGPEHSRGIGEPSNVMKTAAAVELTDRILISGPRLKLGSDSKAYQWNEFRKYFIHFGNSAEVSISKKYDKMTVSFDNCDSAMKCIEQGTHKICDKDFLVRRGEPTRSMKKRLKANQNTSGPSSENVSAPNVQSNPAAGSNVGNQLPREIASSSSQVYGSVPDCSTNSSEWSYFDWMEQNEPSTSEDCVGGYAALLENNKCYQRTLNAQSGGDHTTGTPEERMDTSTSTVGLQVHRSVTDSGELSQSHGLAIRPAEITKRIFVRGPCLHPKEENPQAAQKKEFLKYFRHFGRSHSLSKGRKTSVFMANKTDANVTFDNYDSPAKCIEQGRHTICGRDFFVWATKPTKDMIKAANLEQDMTGPSNENVSVPNIQSETPAESNVGNQLPREIASSSSQVHGSVPDSSEWSHFAEDFWNKICELDESEIYSTGDPEIEPEGSEGIAQQNVNSEGESSNLRQMEGAKRNQSDTAAESNLGNQLPQETASVPNPSKTNQVTNLGQDMFGPSNENVSAPNVQSNQPAESNLGNQLPRETASSSSQVHESRGLASFDKPAVPKTGSAEKSMSA